MNPPYHSFHTHSFSLSLCILFEFNSCKNSDICSRTSFFSILKVIPNSLESLPPPHILMENLSTTMVYIIYSYYHSYLRFFYTSSTILNKNYENEQSLNLLRVTGQVICQAYDFTVEILSKSCDFGLVSEKQKSCLGSTTLMYLVLKSCGDDYGLEF